LKVADQMFDVRQSTHSLSSKLLKSKSELDPKHTCAHIWKRELVAGNEIPRIVALRCIMYASIGKRIVQTIEAHHSPTSNHSAGHRSIDNNNRASFPKGDNGLPPQYFPCGVSARVTVVGRREREFVTVNDLPR
jgi:hypothetical protein